MKSFLTSLLAASATAVLLAGVSTTARQNPVDDSSDCPPTVFECCDGTLQTNCTGHAGKCGLISVCGVPF